ncbi:tRNA pseudouridine(38-40) synthase TruA [Candidatus Schneideria nysicola]|uniref:tRNA pseudouridine(38-40) synthase TruA n=1 Tax=Candidatus Schneideria nysicola TaxID=1081631 RepID=UPI001CAA633F|nr:tRNA pseudouridine(38-40) synthase TruA [Candidatus Schneideria nysicola]UAJ65251.1 tRNA pseudouridine(38-40) synthase TruA [Candidatus Schneideria nysicola]
MALGIEYNGNTYCGWQKQNNKLSIQACIEKAISTIANESITISCAGRTDAKVHAIGQVIHFETYSNRKISAWIRGVNTYLPKDIAVVWVKEVSPYFHARFSAVARRYLYIIYNKKIRSAIFSNQFAYYPFFLKEKIMEKAGQCLLGENDFSAFRSAKCQSNTPYRNIFHIRINRNGGYIIIDIKANSFLYHMVCNIIGCLIEIGSGKKPESYIAKILYSKKRPMDAIPAYPEGLYLFEVDYPAHFEIPSRKKEKFFIL